jgi:tetratricopeptide (TPR) repeat protein
VWGDIADEVTVLDLMTRLADKSLVMIERLASGPTRYWMLEIPRQFAQEKLDEAGEEDAARARHLKYFVAWMEKRDGPLPAELGTWLARVDHEYENLLTALEACADVEGGANYALSLAHMLWLYWNTRGMYGVGRERLGAALRLRGSESLTLARAAALVSMGDLAMKQGALPEARACIEESLTLSRNAGACRNIITALHALGLIRARENDPDTARACFEEALSLAREIGEGEAIESGHLVDLGALAADRGDLAQARALFEEAVAIGRKLGDPWRIFVGLLNLTETLQRIGALEEVRRNLIEVLRILHDLGLRSQAEPALWRLSELAAATDDAPRAARWSATAAALQSAMGSKRQPESERAHHATIMDRVRETLGAKEFARIAAEGAAIGYEEAVAEAQVWLEDSARWLHRS